MYNLFYALIFSQLFANGDALLLEDLTFSIGTSQFTMDMSQYLSCLLAIICTIVVYVCCCLVVAKIIKTVANVFRG